MGPTWGPSGADRTHVGPMLAPWTLLSGMCLQWSYCSLVLNHPNQTSQVPGPTRPHYFLKIQSGSFSMVLIKSHLFIAKQEIWSLHEIATNKALCQSCNPKLGTRPALKAAKRLIFFHLVWLKSPSKNKVLCMGTTLERITYWGWVTHLHLSKLNHHWFR